MEREKYSPYLNALTPGTPAYMQAYEDPSGDNFKYFLDPFYDNTPSVIARYKDYNNYEGNSPTNEQSGGSFAAATTLPNTEDINRDNTLNENESYYEYHVRLRPGEMSTENKYITEVVKGKDVNWYQYRIPVTDFENRIGNIEDFKSIRFMRIYLTGFSERLYFVLPR
jgi:cell surface protein SprA